MFSINFFFEPLLDRYPSLDEFCLEDGRELPLLPLDLVWSDLILSFCLSPFFVILYFPPLDNLVAPIRCSFPLIFLFFAERIISAKSTIKIRFISRQLEIVLLMPPFLLDLADAHLPNVLL